MSALAGESLATNKYAYFASQAKKDGYTQIAALFEETASNEKEHEVRYLALLKNIQDNTVFKRDTSNEWFYRNCGHIHIGLKAPEICPVCSPLKSKRLIINIIKESHSFHLE